MKVADALDLPVLLAFAIDGQPVGKARARAGANGKFYTPRTTAEYQNRIGWLARQAMQGQPRNDLDWLAVVAEFHTPAFTGDVDNFVKALFDGFNKVVWRDDQQVIELHARLIRRSEKPRTEVAIYIAEARARSCATCGKNLLLRQVNAGQTYCSKACYDTGQRKSTYRACFGCGGPVYRSPSGDGEQVFCSQECRRARRGRCRVCGEQVDGPPASGKRFCGIGCSERWHRERESANPAAMVGTCTTCDGPCSRRAKECRGCFLVRRGTEGIGAA